MFNFKKELVLAVPINIWNEICGKEGFIEDKTGEIYNKLLENGEFRYRHEIEDNDNYKQIIPQGLVSFEDKYYVNERLPKQSESRLNYFYSLGFGGHLNPEDDFYEHIDLIQIGLHREINEEVYLPRPYSVKYIGITNIEENVSKYHIGLWFEIKLLKDETEVKEPEKLKGFWIDKEEMDEISDKFESWAKLIYDNILK